MNLDQPLIKRDEETRLIHVNFGDDVSISLSVRPKVGEVVKCLILHRIILAVGL